MNESKTEEIIAVLYMLCALLAFSGGYESWGWIFTAKAVSDLACSGYFAIKENRAEKAEQGGGKPPPPDPDQHSRQG